MKICDRDDPRATTRKMMTGVARTPAGSPEAARGASTTINQSYLAIAIAVGCPIA
jgi:hypothetical protein